MTYTGRSVQNEMLGELSKLVRVVKELESRPNQQALEKEYQLFRELCRTRMLGAEAELELTLLQKEAANISLPTLPDDWPSEEFFESLMCAHEARRASQENQATTKPGYKTAEEPAPGTLARLLQQNKLYLQELAVYVHAAFREYLTSSHSPEELLDIVLNTYWNEGTINQQGREVIIDNVGGLVLQFDNSERGTHYALEPDTLLSFRRFLQDKEDSLQS